MVVLLPVTQNCGDGGSINDMNENVFSLWLVAIKQGDNQKPISISNNNTQCSSKLWNTDGLQQTLLTE